MTQQDAADEVFEEVQLIRDTAQKAAQGKENYDGKTNCPCCSKGTMSYMIRDGKCVQASCNSCPIKFIARHIT